MKKAILEGDWVEVEKLLLKETFKTEKDFQYEIHKQIYLELLEKQEYQKAFTHLTKKLKPLESRKHTPDEFRDLCYLLSCKSVQDAPSFRNWNGAKGSSREKLIEQFSALLETESSMKVNKKVPANRLLELIHQATEYQISYGKYKPKNPTAVPTLFSDYNCFVLPNAVKTKLGGHHSSVKCASFIGEEGLSMVTASSDTLCLWSTESATRLCTKKGHSSRIWDVSSNRLGNIFATASGDTTTKLWGIKGEEFELLKTLTGNEGDVYTVQFSPSENLVVTGGYDKIVRLYDVSTGQIKKTFTGHTSSVSRAIFSPHGNLIVTGSKDSTIKFWDVVSGSCVKTISLHLGEVTSVEMNSSGTLLLSSSKDNSNRLWDVRTTNPIKKFKGHQNTSKNFIRCGFGPNELLVVGGSEDGIVYIWDIQSGQIIQKLKSHNSVVYNAVWNNQRSLLASCSQDKTVKLWWYDASQPLFYDD